MKKNTMMLFAICFLIVFITACSRDRAAATNNSDTSGSDGNVIDTDDKTNTEDDPEAYCFVCNDNEGNPVEGVKIQICTDETCTMQISDENGRIIYDGEPRIYSIHIYRIPEGYELISDREFETTDTYGTSYVNLKKTETVESN